MAVKNLYSDKASLRAEFIRILQCVVRDDISEAELDDNVPMAAQFSIDSMDILDFAIEVRKSFGIDLPEIAIADLRTLRDWYEFTWNELQRCDATNVVA